MGVVRFCERVIGSSEWTVTNKIFTTHRCSLTTHNSQLMLLIGNDILQRPF